MNNPKDTADIVVVATAVIVVNIGKCCTKPINSSIGFGLSHEKTGPK